MSPLVLVLAQAVSADPALPSEPPDDKVAAKTLLAVGLAGEIPISFVAATGVVVLWFGTILVCPIVDATSTSTSYGRCLGDAAEGTFAFVLRQIAHPAIWFPAAAGAPLAIAGGLMLRGSPPPPPAQRTPEWRTPSKLPDDKVTIMVPLVDTRF